MESLPLKYVCEQVDSSLSIATMLETIAMILEFTLPSQIPNVEWCCIVMFCLLRLSSICLRDISIAGQVRA